MKKIILLLCLGLQSFCVLASELGSLDEYEEAYESKTEELLCLQSNEGERFEISFKAARLSKFLENFVPDIKDGDKSEDPIPLFLIESKTLSQVIALCEAHSRGETLDLDLDPQETLDLYEAINYLLIKPLYDFQRKMIFNLIVENSYEDLEPYDIDFMGHLKNYFTEEFRKPANFKDEVEGPDEYKSFYYSIKYPFFIEHTLEGHTDILRYVNFSPDGSKVVTASDDNTAKIWKTLY